MNSLVAVLACCAVAAQANLPEFISTILTQPGEQYKLYKDKTDAMRLPGAAQKEVHTGMNIVNKDQDVDKQDLGLYYWHDDVKYAIPKFLNFIDENHNGKVLESALTNDLKKKPAIVALIECSYLISKSLREYCYADQLLTYGALVMDKQDAQKFYDSLDTDGDGKLTKAEVEAISHDRNHDPTITAEELGAYDQDDVTINEFTEYVTQESINDDFRECRQGKPDDDSGNIDFKNDCLLTELVAYTNDDLTEMDIAVLFRAVDQDDNKKITKEELGTLLGDGATEEVIKRAIVSLDMCATVLHDGNHEIDYGEFRTFMRTPTVLLQAELECTVPLKTQKEEIECLYKQFKEHMKDGHMSVWFEVPDLDQYITFEILDTSNGGKIKEEELSFENAATKKRFMSEVDSDGCRSVCLEEFNEYVNIPHMVFGTGDCLLVSRSKPGDRGKCFTDEIEKIIGNIKYIESKAWLDWFKFYDKTGDHQIDTTDQFGTEDFVKLFLLELGQGGEIVTEFEFMWYVKQQEIAERYEPELKITAALDSFDEDQQKKLNEVLKNYIENEMTEGEAEELFFWLDKEVDGRRDHTLKQSDFEANVWEKISNLIATIAVIEPEGDDTKSINYKEFWLWLHSDRPGAGVKKNPKVKDVFSKECTIKGKTQQEEMDCYLEIFKEGKLA